MQSINAVPRAPQELHKQTKGQAVLWTLCSFGGMVASVKVLDTKQDKRIGVIASVACVAFFGLFCASVTIWGLSHYYARKTPSEIAK